MASGWGAPLNLGGKTEYLQGQAVPGTGPAPAAVAPSYTPPPQAAQIPTYAPNQAMATGVGGGPTSATNPNAAGMYYNPTTSTWMPTTQAQAQSVAQSNAAAPQQAALMATQLAPNLSSQQFYNWANQGGGFQNNPQLAQYYNQLMQSQGLMGGTPTAPTGGGVPVTQQQIEAAYQQTFNSDPNIATQVMAWLNSQGQPQGAPVGGMQQMANGG